MLENKRHRHIFIIIGLIFLIASAFLSWHFNKYLQSDDLNDELKDRYTKWYFFSKVLFAFSFVVAVVPSTLELKYEVDLFKKNAK